MTVTTPSDVTRALLKHAREKTPDGRNEESVQSGELPWGRATGFMFVTNPENVVRATDLISGDATLIATGVSYGQTMRGIEQPIH